MTTLPVEHAPSSPSLIYTPKSLLNHWSWELSPPKHSFLSKPSLMLSGIFKGLQHLAAAKLFGLRVRVG